MNHKKYLIIIFGLVLFVFPNVSFGQTQGVNVQLTVPGCNNNGICEPVLGEDTLNCALDCTVATTTPTTTPTTTTPVTTPGVVSGGGAIFYGAPLVINNLSVTTEENSAVVSWSTNNTSLSIFSWGVTTDEEMGSVSDVIFIANHKVTIKNLSVGTHYYFKISARDLFGHKIDYFGDFSTVSIPNVVTLPNVRDLTVSPKQNDLLLTWRNPGVPEFDGVVVLRSPYGYPRDASDGKIIFEGKGNYVTDSSVKKDTVYYYSVFVYDVNKNTSSGAVGQGIVMTSITGVVTKPISTSTPYFVLNLSDVDFIQDGKSISYSNSLVPVYADKNLTVSISITKIPKSLDIGTITVTDPLTKINSTYLLSFNSPRATYESQINLFEVQGGVYPFTIDLLSTNGQKAKVSGEFAVIKPYRSVESTGVAYTSFYWILILLIIIILILIVLYKRRKGQLSDKNDS